MAFLLNRRAFPQNRMPLLTSVYPTRSIQAVSAFLLVLGCLVPAHAGKLAWTKAEVSSGLHSLDYDVTVSYRPTTALPPDAVITRVLADRNFAGDADIHTSVCWNGVEQCVDITGRSVNTKAFKGLDASKPIYLVHRAQSWRGSRPPIFVKGNVTVWYEGARPN